MRYLATIAVRVQVPFEADGDPPQDAPKPPKSTAEVEAFAEAQAAHAKDQQRVSKERRAAGKVAETDVADDVVGALKGVGKVAEVVVEHVEEVR